MSLKTALSATFAEIGKDVQLLKQQAWDLAYLPTDPNPLPTTPWIREVITPEKEVGDYDPIFSLPFGALSTEQVINIEYYLSFSSSGKLLRVKLQEGLI